MSIRIEFPKTNIVECKFALRTDDRISRSYDDKDVARNILRLKGYIYKVPEYLQGQLSVGDIVVVHCATGYQICVVTKINIGTNLKEEDLAPVVCKCYMQSYFDLIDNENVLKEKKKKLLKEYENLKDLVGIQQVAAISPEFREMLEEFISLGGKL